MTNPKDLIGAKKAPVGLVPPALLIGAAEAMATGAAKYGPFNWRDYSVQYMTYLEAMQRHILALIDGQDDAEDSGVHHLKHVIAGAGILLDCIEAGTVIDDRPKPGPAAGMLRSLDRTPAAPTARVPAPEATLPVTHGRPDRCANANCVIHNTHHEEVVTK